MRWQQQKWWPASRTLGWCHETTLSLKLVHPTGTKCLNVIPNCQIQSNQHSEYVNDSCYSYICLATINTIELLQTLSPYWYFAIFSQYLVNRTPMFRQYVAPPMFRQGGGTAAAETRQRGECQAHADRLRWNERHSRGGISMAFGDFPWDFSWGFSGNWQKHSTFWWCYMMLL